MTAAYIVSAIRTAGGKRNGRLSGWHPNDLAGAVLSALMDRSGVDPSAIEDVIMGCVTQAGEQSLQIGRNAVLASTLPSSTPAVTIDRQCGSSQQAIHFAAQAVMSGTQDMVIAAGVESMSRAPMYSSTLPGSGLEPYSRKVRERFAVDDFSQFTGAEMIARKHGFDREALDAFALQSHRRACEALSSGLFHDEIVPISITLPDGSTDVHDRDEGVRLNATAEGLAALKPLNKDGLLTAGTSSQVCDGSAALLVVSDRALKDHNLAPLARIINLTVTGGDPVIMLEEPLFATERALKKAGLKIDDMDLYEVNEAFASVPLAWLKHLDADPERINVHGGALALGHPLGASGAKLMATLVHALHKRGGRYGLQTMCEGGGLSNVTIIEAL